MTVLKEENHWENSVYCIGTQDALLGGEHGVNNVQARQLANRTLYLLTQLLAGHTQNGQHALTEQNVLPNASIAESKLALDCSTEHLYQNVLQDKDIVEQAASALGVVYGVDGAAYKDMYTALMLTWRYGYPRFAFELFAGGFSLRDKFTDLPVLATVFGDDSIDVENTATLQVNDSYLFLTNNGTQKVVTMKSILSDERAILHETVEGTFKNIGKLSKCSWQVQTGLAFAPAESIYISKVLDTLKDFERGHLLISHKEDASFSVEYRRPDAKNPTLWYPLALISHKLYEDSGVWRSVFETPGGTFLLKITAKDDVHVAHIVLMTASMGVVFTTVRTPSIISGDFRIGRFGAIYGGEHAGTEFQLSMDTDFTNNTTLLYFGASNNSLPVWDYEIRIREQRPFAMGESCYWRVRYKSTDGQVSRWSEVGHYTRTEI